MQHNVDGAEDNIHVKFHFEVSNRLATIHQRHRQTDNGPIAQSEPFLQTVAQKKNKKNGPA